MAVNATTLGSRIGFRLQVAVLLAVSIGLGAVAGWRLAKLTPAEFTLLGVAVPIGLIVGTLTGGAVLSVAKQIWETLARLMTLTASRSVFDWHVIGDGGKVCLAVFGVVFGLLTFKEALAPPAAAGQAVLSAIVFVNADEEPWVGPGSEPLAIFPLMYEQNAKRAANGVGGWGTGVAVRTLTSQTADGIEAADFDAPLRAIVNALKDCAKASSDSEPPQLVQLAVLGYASSREFRQADGTRDPRTDEMNLEVANARAAAVTAALKEIADSLGGSASFKVDARPWPADGGFRLMESSRPYIDRIDGSTEPEMLNRRVEVLLIHAARCHPKPPRPIAGR